MKYYYGLENSFNWGFDWFETDKQAIEAMRLRRNLYKTNDCPIKMSAEEIRKCNL